MCVIYHNPKCSKSRESLKILENSGSDFTIIKYLEQTLSREELVNLLSELNLAPKEFIRSGESIFKELDLKNASNNELIDAMIKHPRLIERPIVKTNKGIRIGRPPESILEIL